MASLIIKKSITFNEIEKLLHKIDLTLDPIKLRIPSKLDFSGGFGLEIALIQLIITWSRLSSSPILHTYFDEEQEMDDYFKQLTSQLYGIGMLSIAPTIVNTKMERISRRHALVNALPRIIAMDESKYSEISKGSEVNFIFVSSAEKEYLKSFYNLNPKVELKSRQMLISEVFNILTYLRGFTSSKDNFDKILQSNVIDKIAQLISELLKNIDEHAKHDYLGNNYLRTIGGIKFAMSEYSKEQISNVFEDNTNISQYLLHLQSSYLKENKIRIFEISVFDSGPGYARRWTKKPFKSMKIEDEVDAFNSCLAKHGTTKDDPAGGEGLSNVRDILKDLHGYIKIRSGRLDYQEFFIKNSNIDINTEPLAPVEGTAISICIPF